MIPNINGFVYRLLRKTTVLRTFQTPLVQTTNRCKSFERALVHICPIAIIVFSLVDKRAGFSNPEVVGSNPGSVIFFFIIFFFFFFFKYTESVWVQLLPLPLTPHFLIVLILYNTFLYIVQYLLFLVHIPHTPHHPLPPTLCSHPP